MTDGSSTMLTPTDWEALVVTLKLAGVTTVILLLVGTPLAWWLARSHWKPKFLIEAVVALPLVLPPTVLGFYLLVAFAPSGPIGAMTSSLGLGGLAFTFTGIVIGSVLYSLPFVVQPLQNAFASINPETLEAASTLGASPLDRFFSVALPLARSGLITAIVLGFAHTVGEFGVVLMIGGNIPGVTHVASIAIYDHVEAMRYDNASGLALLLLVASFALLAIVYFVTKGRDRT